MSGWIKLHRKILEWEWYSDTNTKVVFIHCLVSANYETKNWRGIQIKPGQLYTSLNNISLSLGISVKAVRTALNKLDRTNDVTSERHGNGLLITVVKYSAWQVQEEQKGRPVADPGADLGNDKGQQLKKGRSKEKKNNTFPFLKSLMALGVEEQVAKDWMKVRSKKGGANTKTAFAGIERELKKSILSPTESIRKAVVKNWRGFEADWVNNDNENPAGNREQKFIN